MQSKTNSGGGDAVFAGGKVWLLGYNGKVTARLGSARSVGNSAFFTLQNFRNMKAFMQGWLEGKFDPKLSC